MGNRRKTHHLWLFVFLSACIRWSSGLECYSGTIHKTESNRQLPNVQQCTSKNVMKSKPGSDETIRNCMIFYDFTKDEAQFGCDYLGACPDSTRTQTLDSVCYNKTRGSLHCCQGALCNTGHRLHHMSMPQASTICYNGTNSLQETTINELMCPSSWCYQKSTHFRTGHLWKQTFGCDSHCDLVVTEPRIASCSISSLDYGLHERVCYCSSDRCNHAVHHISRLMPAKPTTHGSVMLTVQHPSAGHSHPLMTNSAWLVVVFIISAVSIILVLLLLAVRLLRLKYASDMRGYRKLQEMLNTELPDA